MSPSPPPNELFTTFSLIGFIMCAIPFYWHFKARSIGTCMFMAWSGLGCLILCIDSIVWNKNMIDRAPVYSSRFQVALNAALPACSLCIQRRLYKCLTVTTGMPTRPGKRAIIADLLICLGIPILQIAAEYVVSGERYVLFEDFGPSHSTVVTPLTFPLFSAWPIAIGTVSLVYCVMNIYHLYKLLRMVSLSSDFNRSLYIRLMALSSIEIIGTVPLASFYIAFNVKLGIRKWSWAQIHSDYSHIEQIPNIVWKNNPQAVLALELFRWSVVLCAFLFFAFFGFAEDARKHYRLVYTTLAHHVGYLLVRPSNSPHGTSTSPRLKNRPIGDMIFTANPGTRGDSVTSFSDQLSIPSTCIASDLRPGFRTGQVSTFDYTPSSSAWTLVDGTRDQSHRPTIATSEFGSTSRV